jgi:hypothetical protein
MIRLPARGATEKAPVSGTKHGAFPKLIRKGRSVPDEQAMTDSRPLSDLPQIESAASPSLPRHPTDTRIMENEASTIRLVVSRFKRQQASSAPSQFVLLFGK